MEEPSHKIKLFESRQIRASWDEDADEGNETVTNCNGLKMLTETVTNCHGLKMLAFDDKRRSADVVDTERVFWSIPLKELIS